MPINCALSGSARFDVRYRLKIGFVTTKFSFDTNMQKKPLGVWYHAIFLARTTDYKSETGGLGVLEQGAKIFAFFRKFDFASYISNR